MIENVFIFVMDSLRLDFLPKRLASKGVVLRTVAQSLFSAPSFATLSTGRYPQEHGVSDWRNTISDGVPTIYDIKNRNCGFYAPAGPDENAIYPVLGVNEKTPVKEMETPFVHLERDPLPHLPFADVSDVEEYFRTRRNDWQRIRQEYVADIQRSVDKLERRLSGLADAGNLDSTLVIVTSDHGDLFGEYGCAAHTAPMTPELVRVPTILIHPELSATDLAVDSATEIVEHVDIVETALQAVEIDNFETSGTNLFDEPRQRDWGYSTVDISRRDRTLYSAEGIWWPEGGYAFPTNSRLNRALFATYRLTRGSARFAQRRAPIQLFNHYLRASHSFGSPPVGKIQSKRLISSFVEQIEVANSMRTELNKETENRLKQLGYLDS